MNTKILITLIAGTMLGSLNAHAITCTGTDFQADLCNLPDAPGVRCSNPQNFKMYCNNTTTGCTDVGGCYGTIAPGNWYPMVDTNGLPVMKCRCGCFAEDTTFNRGGLSAADLIKSQVEGADGAGFSIDALTDLDQAKTMPQDLNGVMFSTESEPVYTFTTLDGKSITVSGGHPVVVSGPEGEISAIKKAEVVTTEDFLINDQNERVAISKIEVHKTDLRVMNFNVMSTNPVNHIIFANGLKMGDLALQTRLNSFESRLMLRADIMNDIEKAGAK